MAFPIGYISNTKEIRRQLGEILERPRDEGYRFIGKDNIVFHCIVFPAMLMAYGDGFQLPDNVPANEFLNLEGDKISTSRNWGTYGSTNTSRISPASRMCSAMC